MKGLTLTAWALIVFSLGLDAQAQSFKLEYFAETSIETGTQFKKSIIGGISGIVWSDGTLYALSDDKGRIGEPRFYEFELKVTDKKVSLSPRAVNYITNIPGEVVKKGGLDPEGLARLPSGDFLVSSEGNSDSKPRMMPQIFQISSKGEWKVDLPLADRYLPETTGQQKKGVHGNLAFESLATVSDGKYVFTATESSLIQDFSKNKDRRHDLVRIIKYEGKPDKKYSAIAEYAYPVDAPVTNEEGVEVYRGVSEVLALSETKFLVLERGVRLNGKIWTLTGGLYLADLSKAQDVSKVEKLSETQVKAAEKVLVLDLEKGLGKFRNGKVMQNFEALSWGPALPGGRRSLLMMSDNNFKKSEITELIIFAVEGE